MVRVPRNVVVVYDGDCGLCRRCIGFMEKRDRRGRFRPVPFQADEAPFLLESAGRTRAEAVRTVLLVRHGRSWNRSAAVVRILWGLRFPWPLAGAMLWLVPKALRDAGYRWVERNRGRWGKQ